MAHMIDTTTGTAAIAYAGKTPWHGLGQALSADADITTWTHEAGLAYDVLESPVLFRTAAASEPEAFKGRKVLHRSDTGAPLAVVSDGYHVVQPAEVMGFFDNLVKLGLNHAMGFCLHKLLQRCRLCCLSCEPLRYPF